MILRIRAVQINYGTRIHIIHIAGTRMIAQGTDGLSRGNLSEGVLTGQNLLSFIPISQSAFDRSDLLLEWFRDWTQTPNLSPLKTSDWPWRGQALSNTPWVNIDGIDMPQELDKYVFLWAPPPCLADVALEYVLKSIHKRPDCYHIFICPKIMTYRWRKHLLKNYDFSFYLDPIHSIWNPNQHESLLIAIFLPLLHCPPWTFRKSKRILAMERKVREMQKDENWFNGSFLLKFWEFCRGVPYMSERLVWQMLSNPQV